MSERLIVSHYENNYGGAVKRLNLIEEQLAGLDHASTPGFVINGLKREELIAMNTSGPRPRPMWTPLWRRCAGQTQIAFSARSAPDRARDKQRSGFLLSCCNKWSTHEIWSACAAGQHRAVAECRRCCGQLPPAERHRN